MKVWKPFFLSVCSFCFSTSQLSDLIVICCFSLARLFFNYIQISSLHTCAYLLVRCQHETAKLPLSQPGSFITKALPDWLILRIFREHKHFYIECLTHVTRWDAAINVWSVYLLILIKRCSCKHAVYSAVSANNIALSIFMTPLLSEAVMWY